MATPPPADAQASQAQTALSQSLTLPTKAQEFAHAGGGRAAATPFCLRYKPPSRVSPVARVTEKTKVKAISALENYSAGQHWEVWGKDVP